MMLPVSNNFTVISIHAPRGGSDLSTVRVNVILMIISIHAPRGGSDLINAVHLLNLGISIHAPRGGSDVLN